MRRLAPHLFVLFVIARALVFAQPSAEVVLSGPLAQWRDEIESMGNRKVILARVYMDRERGLVYLPRDAEQRPVLVEYLQNENFLKEFLRTHAMSISHPSKDGTSLHIVLLNMARQEEWAGHEDAVIGQELARIWLNVSDYVSSAYEGKKNSCIAILANNAAQGELIRREVERRGIDYLGYRMPLLERSLAALKKAPVEPAEEVPTCQLISRMVLWTDVRLSLTPQTWPDYAAFDIEMRRHYPILEPTVRDLVTALHTPKLDDKSVFRDRLEYTLSKLYGFVQLVLQRSVDEEKDG